MNSDTTNNDGQEENLVSVPIYEDHPEDLDDQLDSKEGILSFAFDHIYAITPEAFDSGNAAQREVDRLNTCLSNSKAEISKLKSLMSVHLDLIQKQSDIIAHRDKQVKELVVENAGLRMRLRKQNPSPLITVPGDPQPSRTLLIPQEQQTKIRKCPETVTNPKAGVGVGRWYTVKHHNRPIARPESLRSETIVKPKTHTLLRTEKQQVQRSSIVASQQELTKKFRFYGSQPDRVSNYLPSSISFYGEGNSAYPTNSPANPSTSFDTSHGVQDQYCLPADNDTKDKSLLLTGCDTNPFRKVETSCRDFSYGETISHISSNILSSIERANNPCSSGSTALNSKKWYCEDDGSAGIMKMSPGIISESLQGASHPTTELNQSNFGITYTKMHGKRASGKGKGKKSKTAEVTQDPTPRADPNSIIRSMFMADCPNVPDKEPTPPPSASDERKVKKCFFRSKASDNHTTKTNIEIKQEQSPTTSIYNFEPTTTSISNRKNIKTAVYHSKTPNRLISTNKIQIKEEIPSLASIYDFESTPTPPVAIRKTKKSIYDNQPQDIMSQKKEQPKRVSSPSVSVYSFEDSQDTKVAEKSSKGKDNVTGALECYGRTKRKSRAFSLFSGDNSINENSSASSTIVVPGQRVTCYMDAAKGIRKGTKKEFQKTIQTTTNILSEPSAELKVNKKGRRKSTVSKDSTKLILKTTKGRGRANSLYSGDNIQCTKGGGKISGNNKGRKRAQSTGSRMSGASRADSNNSVILGMGSDKNLFKSRSIIAMSSSDIYYNPVGSPPKIKSEPPTTSTSTLEVPKWRVKNIQPASSFSDDAEENLDDTVFLKRHSKMELEEKRIKRWDFQRLKEQMHLKKLKERQEKLNPGGKKLLYRPYKPRKVIPQTMWPSAENVLAIEIVDTLPVTSFGELMPSYKPRKFNLPWIRKNKKKKSRSHKSDKKRKQD